MTKMEGPKRPGTDEAAMAANVAAVAADGVDEANSPK
jgi:hypothetical protein